MSALAIAVLALLTSGDFTKVEELHLKAVKAQNNGDYATAEKFHRKTLDAIEQIPDFPSNERARQMSNLASVLNLAGKPADALALVLPAAELLEEHPSDDPGQYIVLELNTARAYALLERFDEAWRHCESALQTVDKADAMDTMYGAETRAAQAYVLLKTERFSEAVPFYEFSISFWASRLPDAHPLRVNLSEELAEAEAGRSLQPPSN